MALTQRAKENYHTITPHLTVKDCDKAIDFYKRAFGAEELALLRGPDNKSVMHAELKIGDSILMLNDEFPEWGVLSPTTVGGSSVTINLAADNADAAFDRATSAGATVKMPLANAFWGDRYGQLSDPFGHVWAVIQHLEDLSPEEIKKRFDADMQKMAKPQS